MQLPVTLRLRMAASRSLTGLLLLAHAGVAVLPWLLPLKWWLAAAISTLATISGAVTIATHALRAPPWAIVGLELRDDGLATAVRRSGARVEGRLLGSSFVSRGLVVLNIRPPRRRVGSLAVVLPWDCIGHEEFRRLRVWLRWKVASTLREP